MQENIFYIRKPSLFSFPECLWFLDRGYDDCLFQIKNKEVRKAIFIENKPILFAVREVDETLEMRILKGNVTEKSKEVITNYVIDWFDLRKDLAPFYTLINKDSRIAYMTKDFEGLRLIGIENLFEAVCWSIIGQQINLNFAYKLKRRIVELYGTKVIYEEVPHYLFPTPEKLSTLTIAELQNLQFSQGKAKYILAAASAFIENRLSKDILVSLPTFEARQNALTSIKGIGIWTANYVLMKSLRDSGSIPFGDVGLLKALVSHQIIEERNEVEKILEFFYNYKGWESYLVFYLWRSLAVPVFPK